ncbi:MULTISPECIES: GAF and ANTAR domain-containing protein [Amycolatopsis]|uniref:GAF and ANTAR domain-containing protein n=1 Tax=Amycolatopsis tucumanensis TaxID=401106 RepID=A0ABP7IMH8_9PSEU|nr:MULTISPECIES: GAF and ANTAR domain-containing protein [Amycolatopsis]MCF6422849.1 ANTAR domain-containing protein [Amycolatopsis tucumanensis]
MRTELIDALLELLARESEGFDVHRFAQDLAERATVLVPARDAGVLVSFPAEPVEIAAGTGAARDLVRLQLELGEGPAPECLHSGSSGDGPWPRFSPACKEAGYSSVHTLPIDADGEVFGALCLFDVGGNTHPAGPRLAHAAALRLAHQRDLHQLGVRLRHLQTALDSRVVIEQAKGMLAERHKIGVDTAFEGLRRYARDHNQRVADLARAIVDGRDPVRSNDF